MQMNNKSDNMFSENTFTFEAGKNGITNELMEAIYNYVTDRIEELKYGTEIIKKIPDFESMKVFQTDDGNNQVNNESTDTSQTFFCPNCKAPIVFGAAACNNCGQTFDWSKV